MSTDWFNLSSLASQAKKLADTLADTIVTTAEHAKEELEREQSKVKLEAERNNLTSFNNNSNALLPWETNDEKLAILSDGLMEKILNLSLSERNFTVTPTELSDIPFDFKTYVPIIMKLLAIDINLSKIHAKFSPKMDEELFWSNYYRRTMYLRAVIGLEGEEIQEKYSKIDLNKVIYFSSSFEDDYKERKLKRDDVPTSIPEKSEATAQTFTADEIKLAEDEALAAEIEEELNNNDIDIDLDDLNLDDDKDEDFENIDDDFDGDLDTQIKKELEEMGDENDIDEED